MELYQILLPALHERFPDRGLQTGNPPQAVAVFPGLHPGIQAVSIYDDGDELTVSIEPLMHGHFNEYARGLSNRERCERIVAAVISFLEALFADRVVVWGKPNVGGGWYVVSFGGEESYYADAERFVWSGPYSSAVPAVSKQAELAPAQVIGQRLSEIRQVSELNTDGLDWTTSYFVLESGVSFVLPDEMADGLCLEPPPAEAVRLEGVEAIKGKRITALLKPKPGSQLPLPSESLYLLFENGILATDVMGAYHGTGSTGIYLHAGEIDFRCLEIVWGALPQTLSQRSAD